MNTKEAVVREESWGRGDNDVRVEIRRSADLNKTLKLTATRYFGAKPQDQGCHSEPNLIKN